MVKLKEIILDIDDIEAYDYEDSKTTKYEINDLVLMLD